MSNDPITAHYRCSAPVSLAVRLKGHLSGPPNRAVHEIPVTGPVLSFRMNGREICHRDFRPEQGQKLLDGPIFDDPVRLGILCRTTPAREQGLMHVALAAVATTQLQEAQILEADRTLGGGMHLWNLPDDLVGFDIGYRRFPASPEVLEPIPVGPDSGPRLAEFGHECKKFADRVLWGDPQRAVDQLLAGVVQLDSRDPHC